MKHVAVMTATSGVGLMSLFFVDVANLFYISLLGQVQLAAAIGFAGTIQFFMISVSIGLSIAATAVVSRAIGAGQREAARRLAASALVILVAVLSVVAVAVWVLRDEALTLLGATGEAHAVASRFLAIVLPGMPLLGVGMVCGGLLRAVGDARRAMFVTLGGGLLAAVLDPLFIFGFGLGVDGAAVVSLIARVSVAAIGLIGAVRVHDMIAWPRLRPVLADGRVLASIATPAVATQLSTPFGMAYLTGQMAQYGDEAVAAWAVIGRLTALGFGGIFALSGAVGPIMGQNHGAGLTARIRATYRDALIFASLYVVVVWAALWLSADWIAQGFGLTGNGLAVLEIWTTAGAAAYLFTAALFVSNACFNNLGRPAWSTAFNWSRDAVVLPLLGLLVGSSMGAAGVVLVQAGAGVLVGAVAAVVAWRYVARLDGRAPVLPGLPRAVAAPFASRAAMAALEAASTPSPLAESEKTR